MIFKVVENHIYFVNRDTGDSVIVMDFNNQQDYYTFKLEDTQSFKFQSITHPFILSSYGVYNVFYPRPLVSRHANAAYDNLTSGIPFED